MNYAPLLDLENSAEQHLEYFSKEYPATKGVELPLVDTSTEVRFGIPGFAISEYANINNFDLVIMGSRDKHGLFDRLMGSASSITIQVAKCPVLIIHESTKYNDLKKIVFAIDDKGELKDSLEAYLELNNRFEAETHFIHVNKEGKDDISSQQKQIEEQLNKSHKSKFNFEINQVSGKNVRQALMDYCLFEKADMLVMMHQKEGLVQNFFKSHDSIRVAQEFHLPVMVCSEED
jgi:nucleotide-binding universal stress UspA family protein